MVQHLGNRVYVRTCGYLESGVCVTEAMECDVLRYSGITDPLREVIVQHFTLQPFEYDTLFPSPAVRPCFVAYWVVCNLACLDYVLMYCIAAILVFDQILPSQGLYVTDSQTCQAREQGSPLQDVIIAWSVSQSAELFPRKVWFADLHRLDWSNEIIQVFCQPMLTVCNPPH